MAATAGIRYREGVILTIGSDISKVVIWRAISLTLGFFITFLYLGEIKASIELMIIVNIFITIAHYIFERLWNKKFLNR